MSDRCLRPVMPSATTAESRDSRAASKAMETAGLNSSTNLSKGTVGMRGNGRWLGTSPKREWMVLTGRWKSCTSKVVARIAISEPGTFLVTLGQKMVNPSATPATPTAQKLVVGRALAKVASLGRKRAGTLPGMVRPSRSPNWVVAMIRAIPVVKPTVSGNGTNFTNPPRRSSPITTSMTPASSVATASPSYPYFWTIPYTMTMKAPVGPPICTLVPPRAETRKPATMAV